MMIADIPKEIPDQTIAEVKQYVKPQYDGQLDNKINTDCVYLSITNVSSAFVTNEKRNTLQDKKGIDIVREKLSTRIHISLKEQMKRINLLSSLDSKIQQNIDTLLSEISLLRPSRFNIEVTEDESLYFTLLFNDYNVYIDYYLAPDDEEDIIISKYSNHNCIANWGGSFSESFKALAEITKA